MANMFRAISTAITNAIDSLSLPESAVVESGFSVDLEELMQSSAIRVVVTPRGLDATAGGRSQAARELRAAIFIGGRAASDDAQWQIVDIAEQIVLLFTEGSVTQDVSEALNAPASVAISNISVDLANEDTLNERTVFRAIIEATFKCMG